MAGLEALRSVTLAGHVRPASGSAAPGSSAGQHRVLPVLPELSRILPGRGLRHGSTIAVAARPGGPTAGGPAPRQLVRSGGTSLVIALLVEASRAGAWCAVVGLPAFGAVAAAQVGVALDRLALVPHPGPDWPTVVAALIDGVDIVVIAAPGPVSASVSGRLAARARQRGTVLVPYGRWAGADVTLQVARGAWEGLGQGRGRLRCRHLSISAQGRGAAARPKEVRVWLPAASGAFGGTVTSTGAGVRAGVGAGATTGVPERPVTGRPLRLADRATG